MLGEVFKPFGQADGSRARHFDGVGLRLAMANSIASLHSARIDIESVPDLGTTVVVTIPANRVAFEKYRLE